jgi:hypothetical protein
VTRDFLSEEAEELIGKRVQSLIEFSGIPRWTTGTITERYKTCFGHWGIGVTWDKKSALGGKPITDGFSKDEYERFLIVIP